MNKVIIAILGLCLVQAIATAPTDEEAKTVADVESLISSQPAHNFIAAIYRRSAVQALQQKVQELQTKLTTGQNAIPAAVDILKIALFSSPTQDMIKKAAEHVLNVMSPELKEHADEAGLEEFTTPMPKKVDLKAKKDTPAKIKESKAELADKKDS